MNKLTYKLKSNENQLFMNFKIQRIMKKQVLILAFFVLAIFAGTNKSFGQTALSPSTFSTLPNPLLNCVGDALHPKAGVSYTYTLDPGAVVPAPTEYRFWATKDPDFISGSVTTTTNQADSLRKEVAGELLNYSPNYRLGGATANVSITWSPEILAKTDFQSDPGAVAPAKTPTFVVGWATNGCSDNIKVWEIDPTPSFTVDITNIAKATELPLAYGATTTQCVDITRAAKYSATKGVDYNYGKDTLYYEVIASNFVTSWRPTFFLTGLDGTIQTADIALASSWANMTAATPTLIESGSITAGTYAGTTDLTSTVANTTQGVSLIVRVIVSNNNYETLTQSTLALSVAGRDTETFDIDDDATCTVPTDAADAADDDVATRTIDPRPSIGEGTTPILTNTGIAVP